MMGLLTRTGQAEKVAGSDRVAEFFNHRQGGLQLFLSRVAAHGELSASPMVSTFLTMDQNLLGGFKKQVKDAETARNVSHVYLVMSS
jgi:hypothetical protein